MNEPLIAGIMKMLEAEPCGCVEISEHDGWEYHSPVIEHLSKCDGSCFQARLKKLVEGLMGDGTFKVMAKRCDECLFGDNKIVDDARRREVLSTCRRNDSHFICHKATIADNQDVCCRGFFDANPGATNLMRIAARLGVVSFVTEESLTAKKSVKASRD